jgi:hypothetical protein
VALPPPFHTQRRHPNNHAAGAPPIPSFASDHHISANPFLAVIHRSVATKDLSSM